MRRGLLSGGAFLVWAAIAGADSTHVDPGPPALFPDGSVERPFQRVDAGLCEAHRTDGEALLAGGAYGEFPQDQPGVVEAWPGRGDAVFGQAPLPNARAKVMTYNSHLWGDHVGWAKIGDAIRVPTIGDRICGFDADFVGLQEVWDDDYFDILRDHACAAYTLCYCHDGVGYDAGLAHFSRHPTGTSVFYEFEAQGGDRRMGAEGSHDHADPNQRLPDSGVHGPYRRVLGRGDLAQLQPM